MASKSSKSSMKKEGGEKTMRPSSSRRQSFPKGSNYTGGIKSKQIADTLSQENADLQEQVATLTLEGKQLREKWLSLTSCLVEEAKTRGFELSQEEKAKTLVDIPVDSLLVLIKNLAKEQETNKKKKPKGSVESRIEELETRITQMNMNLVKLLNVKMNLEQGLEDIQQSVSLEDARNKARFLMFEARGNEVFTFLGSENEDEIENEEIIITESKSGTHPGKYQVDSIVKELQTFHLDPPRKKLPGDTLVKDMDPGLKHYIVNELSLYKANGADWRMMAERVGISADTVAEWRQWRLEFPMQHVLETWGRSPAATMRMLHRHLVSPQMKAVLLARRISDFYLVD